MKRLSLLIFTLTLGMSMVAVAADVASTEKIKIQDSTIKTQQQGRLVTDSDDNEVSNETHHFDVLLQNGTVSSHKQEARPSSKNSELKK